MSGFFPCVSLDAWGRVTVGCTPGTWGLPHSLLALIFGSCSWMFQNSGGLPRPASVPQMCLDTGSLQLD